MKLITKIVVSLIIVNFSLQSANFVLNKEKSSLPSPNIEFNYSLLIAILSVCVGFILMALIASLFLIFGKNSIDEFNQASYDLVKGFKEISDNRITNEVLKLQIQV